MASSQSSSSNLSVQMEKISWVRQRENYKWGGSDQVLIAKEIQRDSETERQRDRGSKRDIERQKDSVQF